MEQVSKNHSEMRKKILVADASPAHVREFETFLAGLSVDIISANNGHLAMEMALESVPDLIITDALLPEINGYQLTAHLKSSPQLKHIPVVLVSTMSDAQDAIRGLNSGADRLLLKPYEKSGVLDCIHHAWANLEATPAEEPTVTLHIEFKGQRHRIKTNARKAIQLLLSTYEATVQRHQQLVVMQTELRQRSAEVLRTNRFLDSLIECDPNLISIKEAHSLRYTRVNRAFESVIGIPRQDLLGKNDTELFPKDSADLWIAIDQQALASTSALEFHEEPVQTRGRGQRLLHTKKVVVPNEEGAPSHVLGISEDVTVKRELEKMVHQLNADLARKVAELEASNKDLDSFSYSVAHDLRTPLSVIAGYTGLLEKQLLKNIGDTSLRHIQTIQQTAKNMAALIDDLLTFSRLARQAIKKTEVDMMLLVKKVTVNTLRPVPREQWPAIEIMPLPTALADPSLLTQVWTNLISNAIKYSKKAPSPQISISGVHRGTEVIYSVKDNGAGFDMGQYEKLFGIFQRLHSSDEFEGTGIGLAIVHRVIAHHGGRIWAEGQPGLGATFHFALPAHSDTADPKHPLDPRDPT